MKTMKKIIPALIVAGVLSLFAGCTQIFGSMMVYGEWKGTTNIMGDDVDVEFALNSDLTFEKKAIWSATSFITDGGTWIVEEGENGVMLLALTVEKTRSELNKEGEWTVITPSTYKYKIDLSGDDLTLTRVDSNSEKYVLKKVSK